VSEDPFLHNQKTTARLLGISVQAFQRWDLTPEEVRGSESFYDWNRVRKVAEQKKATRTGGDRSELRVEYEQSLAHLRSLPGDGILFRLVIWCYHRELLRALPGFWQEYAKLEIDDDHPFFATWRFSKKRQAELLAGISHANAAFVELFLREHFDACFEALTGIGIDALMALIDPEAGPTEWPPYGFTDYDEDEATGFGTR
jgi:hypothetical protein